MQTNRIHKLSPLLINQIAAGEVVTRPASVVKELIENAIDAHATHIRIDIEQGGLGLIQISDNGDGIHPDDMTLAVTRHATSKLADVGELAGIDSLGFRGEALASIAAVSHLTLTSSHNDSGIGQQLSLNGSEISQVSDDVKSRPVVKNRGTTVTVRDLYYNVPARRSHLKSIATEFAHIEQVVQRLAICYPAIQMELYHQDKLRFSLSNIKNLRQPSQDYALQRLEQALNLPLADIAQPLYMSLQGLQPKSEYDAKVTGWLFVAENTNLPKLIYINQRLVSDLVISGTMQKVARQLGIGQHDKQQMGYALFFDLPTDWINVNIHPSKQQVKIQPLTNILAWLNQKVVEQLQTKLTQISTNRLNEENEPLDNGSVTEIDEVEAKNVDPKSQSRVAEGVSDYHTYEHPSVENNKSITVNPYINQNCPKVLSMVSHSETNFALIFWQKSLYLLDLTNLALPNLKVDSISEFLNDNDLDVVFNNAMTMDETDLIHFMLSQKNTKGTV